MTSVLPELVLEIQSRGFQYLGRDSDRWLRFEGPLNTPEGSFECDLAIDPSFFSLPVVQLKELPESLGPITPHLGPNGGLCYLDKGTVVLDIFDPIGQTLRCLGEAEKVLGSLLRGEMIEDLEEEFHVHWHSRYCFFDMYEVKRGEVTAFCVTAPSGLRTPVLTDDLPRTVTKIDAMQVHEKRHMLPAYVVETVAKPRASQNNWPPSTVAEILNWQRELDGGTAKKLYQRIGDAYRHKRIEAVIIIKSPNLIYGFQVHFDQSILADSDFEQARGAKRLYSFRVTRLTALRIDDRHIAQRSIPSLQTLAGLRIVLVGCGTIGGYLADLLAKTGAGTGGGKLTLVDFELLMPHNVGRHRLGLPFSLHNKASALSNVLKFDTPGISASALEVDVRDAHLGSFDLLIDATGEEALGHWLAARYAQLNPILSVWVEGPGTAVRALLKTPGEGACYRCLTMHSRAGQYSAVQGTTPHVMAGHGCDGLYVPFPVTVSIQAAALANEMALAWVNDKMSHSLQTKITDSTFKLASGDSNPPQIEGCPACGS